MKRIEGRVGIILAGSVPTEREQEIIDLSNFAKRTFCNGRFAECNSGERLNCSHILNLSGRKDIDKFYKDILLDLSDFYEEKVEEKPKKAPKKAPKKSKAKSKVKGKPEEALSKEVVEEVAKATTKDEG